VRGSGACLGRIGHGTVPPVRVVQIITRLNVGGPAAQVILASDRLTPRGFETLVVHGRLGEDEGDMRYLLPAARVQTRYVPALRRRLAPLRDLIALVRILAVLRAVQPQIVHTHTAKAGTLGRIAAAIHNSTSARRAPTRIVHTYHGHVLRGYFVSPVATFFTWTERRLARLTDAIVAISPQIRNDLVEAFHIGRAEQYHVIPLGFELGSLVAIDDEARRSARVALGIPAEAHVVTTVGRLTAIKQHRLFLETAKQVAERDSSTVFLIAGDGELRAELEQLARSQGVDGRTRFLGWRLDLATVYGATDVFLLTSRNEGTPVALIESLASGVPGVATDVGGVRDVIDSDEIGLLAPFGDASALARHVNTLLADPPRRRAMGARGRAAVVARYQVDQLVDQIESLYHDLLAPRP
jgi:glycosyltransferase involved in cell wall biosynthesis